MDPNCMRADGHPDLSAAHRNSLAEQIAAIDGVTSDEARAQIDSFMSVDLGGPRSTGVSGNGVAVKAGSANA